MSHRNRSHLVDGRSTSPAGLRIAALGAAACLAAGVMAGTAVSGKPAASTAPTVTIASDIDWP